MNKRAVLIITLLTNALFYGCMSVKMPEHMISDTVDAGKKIYEGLSETEKNGIEFSYTIIIEDSLPIKTAVEQCYTRLGEHIHNELKNDNISLSREKEKINKQKRLYSIECTITAKKID